MASIRKARMRATALRAKHGVDQLPIDVEKLAEAEGVEVDRADFGEEISGVLVKDGERAMIGINARDASTRQRFTIAHELGHHLLHSSRELFVDRDYVIHFRDEKSAGGYDPMEVEA